MSVAETTKQRASFFSRELTHSHYDVGAVTIDTLNQACQLEGQPAPDAFENLMTRGLQFALLIALCCVLHRYGSQDIHC